MATPAHKFDALASVRRLIQTGNNKSFWRRREQEILAEIAKSERPQ